MISILTCGYKPQNREKLEKSIRNTIQYDHEFLYHDNRITSIGICEAYNRLAKKAKGNYLCFVHEDVEFLETGWGANLIENLKSCDVIGVAGGKYKALTPSGWSISGHNCIKMSQYYGNKSASLLLEEDFQNEVLEDVVCIDGVFIAMRKFVFDEVQFDELNFKGFHGYDYDFCLSARKKFKLCVAKNISILHYSEGRNDKSWLEAQIAVTQKHKSVLPAYIENGTLYNKDKNEFLAYKQCLYKMSVHKFFLPSLLIKFFHRKHLYFAWLYIFNKKYFNQIP